MKKRKKKYKKLWHNTIPLNQYKEKLGIRLIDVIQGRKERYKEEELFQFFGYYFARKEVEPIIKGFNKKCYYES
jgi:hypothetical protein